MGELGMCVNWHTGTQRVTRASQGEVAIEQ